MFPWWLEGHVLGFDEVASVTPTWYFGTRGRLYLDSSPGALKDGGLSLSSR